MNYKLFKESALVLRAINNETRQQILDLLNNKGEQTVTEIMIRLRMDQSVVSQHLGILRNAGIVNYRADGKFRYYFIEEKKMNLLKSCCEKLAA